MPILIFAGRTPVRRCIADEQMMNIFREQLTPLLAPKCVAELETQVVIDHLDENDRVVVPDMSLTTPREATGSPAAVAIAEPLPVRLRVPLDIPTRLVSMYIRQRPNETLVAVLELLSPVNKRRGAGRTEYLEKAAPFCAPAYT